MHLLASKSFTRFTVDGKDILLFSPHCIHCMQRGPATRKLSVRLSNAWIVTKRKKRSAHIRKITYPVFIRRRMVGGGQPLLPEILGQADHVGAKSPIFSRYSSWRLSRNTCKKVNQH